MLPGRVDIFNQSSEYCQIRTLPTFSFPFIFIQTIILPFCETIVSNDPCASSPIYIYTTENKTGWSKYPSIFPGSSILPFSSVPVTVSSNHEIDNGRAKKSGYGFLGIAGFFDRLSPSSSFQPRSSQLHREKKFNFSSSTLIYPHAGGYRYLHGWTCRCTVYLYRLFIVNRSFDPIFELFINFLARLKCVICIPSL